VEFIKYFKSILKCKNLPECDLHLRENIHIFFLLLTIVLQTIYFFITYAIIVVKNTQYFVGSFFIFKDFIYCESIFNFEITSITPLVSFAICINLSSSSRDSISPCRVTILLLVSIFMSIELILSS